MRRWREAGAMYHRAETYAKSALKSKPLDEQVKDELTLLIEDVDKARYSSLAYAVLEEDDGETNAVPSVQSNKAFKGKKVSNPRCLI